MSVFSLNCVLLYQLLIIVESIFMVVAGHADSDELSDDEAYDEKSMTKVMNTQPAVEKLIQQNRFASVGFTHNPSQVCFNSKQRQRIKAWIDTASN